MIYYLAASFFHGGLSNPVITNMMISVSTSEYLTWSTKQGQILKLFFFTDSIMLDEIILT